MDSKKRPRPAAGVDSIQTKQFCKGQDDTKGRGRCYRDWLNRSVTRAVMQDFSTSSTSIVCTDASVYGSTVRLSEWCNRVKVAVPSMCIDVEFVEEPDTDRNGKHINIPVFHGLGML